MGATYEGNCEKSISVPSFKINGRVVIIGFDFAHKHQCLLLVSKGALAITACVAVKPSQSPDVNGTLVAVVIRTHNDPP